MTAGELAADYITFGPIGESSLGGGERAPLDLFQWWSQMIEVPVVAEGALTDALIAEFALHTDFFGIGDEIWSTDDPKSRLLDFVAAMS
jgi:thiamine-phosphate pyrophosphorylase